MELANVYSGHEFIRFGFLEATVRLSAEMTWYSVRGVCNNDNSAATGRTPTTIRHDLPFPPPVDH